MTVIAAVPSKSTPLIALAVAKAVAVSALPSKAPSNLVASISPEALNVTPSPAPTLNMIWLSVPNLIWLSASLPITKLVFNIDVIPVWVAETATSFVLTVIPVPWPTDKVTSPESAPPVKPLPSWTLVISPTAELNVTHADPL